LTTEILNHRTISGRNFRAAFSAAVRVSVPDYVDWKDVDYLRRFIPERGKIMPRRISGVTAKDQRRICTSDQTRAFNGFNAVCRTKLRRIFYYGNNTTILITRRY
jgi:ribosomal protein S18